VYRFLWSLGQIYLDAAEVSPEFNLLNVFLMFLSLESQEINKMDRSTICRKNFIF
jgi:hypothetical protein